MVKNIQQQKEQPKQQVQQQEQPKQQLPKQPEQNETKEVMQEINDIKSNQGSTNDHDEEIVRLIVESVNKRAATKEARLLEIEKMQIESDKEFKRIAQDIEKARMQNEHSREVVKMVWDGMKWIAVTAAIATMYVVTQVENKKIEIEKIKQGL